ncbi:MAG: penicillin-binding protein activator [Rhodanobacteraceae bacterium]|nr:MAG: penicillin-binding protein activator [Rhodanobacteraceae bacterium]
MPRIRPFAHLAFACSALMLLAGCAGLGPSTRISAPAQSAPARLAAANAALAQGHAGTALGQLAGLPDTLPPALEVQVLDTTARAQLALGHRIDAARAMAKRIPLLPPAEQASEHQRLTATLSGAGTFALQSAYPSLADGDPVKPYVRQALVRAGVAVARPLPQLNAPVGTLSGAATPQGFVMPRQVALLLPATGPVAVAGAAVRDGFFAAYFHPATAQGQRPAVKMYDTGGTPAGAVAAYQRAAAAGATLVVGPLGRAAVAAVFAQPDLPVRVLALNHAPGDQVPPPGSAEFALTPEAEGAQLAAHLLGLGLHAAIVFRGADSTAARTFGAFKTQFQSQGGQVANDIVLPPGAVDFASQIQAALAGSGAQTGIVALLRPVQARLLLPQLRLAQSTLPVFSTSMVYSGDANATANTDLDGLQFSDAPWLYDAQAGLPSHAALAALLATADGPAARLFAFGMDAYALMPYLQWLHTHPGSYLAGATGQLSMDAFQHVQRTPVWVEFQGGVAQPVAAGMEPPQPAPDAVPTGP